MNFTVDTLLPNNKIDQTGSVFDSIKNDTIKNDTIKNDTIKNDTIKNDNITIIKITNPKTKKCEQKSVSDSDVNVMSDLIFEKSVSDSDVNVMSDLIFEKSDKNDESIPINIPVYESEKREPLKNKKILIFSGGGVKGVAHIGVLNALYDLGYLNQFHTFACASVGTLIASLYLIGYDPKELWEFIKKFDLSKIRCLNVLNFFENLGLDCGKNLDYVIKRLISAKGHKEDITLGELFQKTKKKLILTTVCINTKQTYYISHETHPFLPLHKAIRMSISIPIYYTPVEHHGKFFIDGGCIDNYPIHIFEKELSNVLGIHLSFSPITEEKIDNLETFLLNVVQCLLIGVNFNSIKGYESYTIEINTDCVNFIDFDLNINKKQQLYDLGWKAIMDFVK